MYEFFGVKPRFFRGAKTTRFGIILLAGTFAGCSADITRFDSASFNLNDPPQTTSALTPPPAPPADGLHDTPLARSQPRGPYGAGVLGGSPRGVEVAALPDAAPPAPGFGQSERARPPRQALASAPPSISAKGEAIEVQSGDTLYGLSRRHQVSIAELMAVNELKSPNLKLGQKLYLPGAGSVRAPLTRSAALPQPKPAPVPAELSARYHGTYTVQPGDSLYKIARANKVRVEELQKANGIVDPRRVKPGFVLHVPSGSGNATVASGPVPSVAEPQPRHAPDPAIASSGPPPATPTVINSGRQVASLNDKATDAVAEPAQSASRNERVANAGTAAAPAAASQVADNGKLRWPASGKVIGGFGPRPDGTHNDGINLSVPLGTDVHAAEGGVVAYSGSELKGYGNLVLVRHDNGWVTAYAHNDELLVKRNDKIKRGQVIAKAGKTGSVDQPQVHFELRQGSKPVDPTPFMERL